MKALIWRIKVAWLASKIAKERGYKRPADLPDDVAQDIYVEAATRLARRAK